MHSIPYWIDASVEMKMAARVSGHLDYWSGSTNSPRMVQSIVMLPMAVVKS